jgi:hypothetical protein
MEAAKAQNWAVEPQGGKKYEHLSRHFPSHLRMKTDPVSET